MHPRQLLFTSLALGVLSACGDSATGNNNNNNGGAAFSATIDGAAWNSLAITSAVTGSTNGTFTLVGSNAVTTTPITMSITLYNIAAPGTYPLGVGGSVTGGTAVVSSSTSSWSTPLTGAAGTVTITAVSATHITGSFSFVATPISGTLPNKTVTNGQFDLAVIASGVVTVPEKAGGSFTGTLSGAPFTAATLLMITSPSSGTLTFSGGNSTNAFNVIISGYTGVGTYTLNTGVSRNVTLTQLGVTKTWGGSNGLSTGTIVVTSATASRVKGTMNVTLQPGIASPGTGTQTFVGTFDVGVP